MEHKHGVYDSDTRFSINAVTRQIKSDPKHKTTLMQNDHNSERFTFELPRYIEQHDMSLCNQVEVHYLNSDAKDKNGFRKGLYTVEDLQISPDDPEKVVCSWLISQNATQLVGKLSFRLRFKCVEDGVITYAWHTAIFADVSVSDGINADETFTLDYVDIIEQWKEAVRIEFAQWHEETVAEMSAEVTAWKEVESGKVRGEMTAFSAQWNDALNVERKRIDQFVALPNGSTTGDAELIDARIGEHGEHYDNLGNAIRMQMEEKIGRYEALAKRAGKNLFDSSTAIRGCFLDGGGTVVTNEKFFVGDYISVIPGEKYTYSPLYESGAHICFYDHAKNVNAGESIMMTGLAQSGNGCITIPEGIYFVRISQALACLGSVQFELGEVATSFEKYCEYKPIADIEKTLETRLCKQVGKNLFNKDSVTSGYFLNGSGGFVESASSFVSDFIRVDPETDYVFNTTEGGGRYVCFYTDGKERISGTEFQFTSLYEAGSGVFTTPQNAVYVRFSNYLSLVGAIQLEKGSAPTEYEEWHEYKPLYELEKAVTKNSKQIASVLGSRTETLNKTADALNAGGTIEFEAADVKKNKRINFYAKIMAFSGLKLGHGFNSYGGSYIEIDTTTVQVYQHTTEAVLVTSAKHGLTFSEFISVVINCQNNAKIIITTATGQFVLDSVNWSGCNGTVFATSVNSALTECNLAWCCSDVRAKAWVFGDSYISLTSPDRFGRYIVDAGFTNWLACGFAGSGASQQMESFNKLLEMGVPKYAVFLLGMNNPDGGSVNNSWKKTIEEFVSVCNEHGITPILATIPSVPGRDHTYKNEYVRTSGHRFIDWERAVGAHESTEWFAGMLSADMVHPSAKGAMALAAKLMNDFPEIMM